MSRTKLTIGVLVLALLAAGPALARGEKGARGAVQGESAPDFQLGVLGQEELVVLSSYVGDRPVVLVFGSYTCPPFRSQIPAIEALYQQHKGDAAFFLVYISEAHPAEPGHAIEPENEAEGISIRTHKTYDDRLEAAATCQAGMELSMPVLVDTVYGRTEKAYGAWPARLYVIGVDGRVAYQGGPGPAGVKAEELGANLRRILAAGGSAPPAPPSEQPAPAGKLPRFR